MRKIIAISGLAASGKGTIARTFARKYGWRYVDLGLIFRAITYALENKKARTIKEAGKMIEYRWKKGEVAVLLKGRNILKDILTPGIALKTAKLSYDEKNLKEISKVAERIADQEGDLICDGRNAGTTIFPNADLKIFVSANILTRAKRRQKDNEKLGFKMRFGDILNLLETRDRIDSERIFGSSKKPKGALEINTDVIPPEETADLIWSFIKN